MVCPMGVAGPIRVTRSFSSRDSMWWPSCGYWALSGATSHRPIVAARVPAVDARTRQKRKPRVVDTRDFSDRPLARYFSNAMALLAFWEACVMLPALQAASASFTSDCALVTFAERGV